MLLSARDLARRQAGGSEEYARYVWVALMTYSQTLYISLNVASACNMSSSVTAYEKAKLAKLKGEEWMTANSPLEQSGG